MIKKLSLSLLLCSMLFAYSDSDLDGIEDRFDSCPNTPFSDLVDASGCPVNTASAHHFDVIYGLMLTQTSNYGNDKTQTLNQTFQIDYYYKEFSVQAASSTYDAQSLSYSSRGLNDSFLGLYYTLRPVEKLALRLGGGVIIPTYKSELENNRLDYTASLSLSYDLGVFSLFGGYSYTLINDEDILFNDGSSTTLISYQNTHGYYGGVEVKIGNGSSMSMSYSNSQSIYFGDVALETLSLSFYYPLGEHWFWSAGYGYGLSESASDDSFSVRVGVFY